MELLETLLGLDADALAEAVSELGVDDVESLLSDIGTARDEYSELLGDPETKVDALEKLEALGAIKAAVTVRGEAIADEASELADREAAALAALSDDADAGDAGDGDGEGAGDGEAGGDGDGDAGDGDGAGAGTDEAGVKGQPVFGSDVNFNKGGNPSTDPTGKAGEAGPQFAGSWGSARQAKALAAAARLGVAEQGTTFDGLRELAIGMSDAYNTGDLKEQTLSPNGDVIARAKSNLPEELTISQYRTDGASTQNGENKGADPEYVESVMFAATRYRQEAQAEVASGGICVPFAPTYDIFDCGAVAQSPVEGALPVVSDGGRGGIKFPLPMDRTDVRPGIGIITCADDEAGYAPEGPTPRKPCIKVPCPTFDEVCVTAISRCLCFGNLNFRTYPEWVQRRLEDLDIEYASVKETFFLDGIDAGSTPVPGCPNPYGALRSVIHDLMQHASAYRKRHCMPKDAMLEWFAPDYLCDVARLDMINDHSMGLGFLDATVQQVTSAIAMLANVTITWYNDSATGAGQVDWATAGGKWPTTPVSYLFAPGTFVRIDGGALDIGVFRDKALIEENDFCIFAEEFLQVAMIGCESLRINHTGICPTGIAAPTAGPLVCG